MAGMKNGTKIRLISKYRGRAKNVTWRFCFKLTIAKAKRLATAERPDQLKGDHAERQDQEGY